MSKSYDCGVCVPVPWELALDPLGPSELYASPLGPGTLDPLGPSTMRPAEALLQLSFSGTVERCHTRPRNLHVGVLRMRYRCVVSWERRKHRPHSLSGAFTIPI